ncbi:MAG: ABC transporter ATP-binding protein [Alicyclobacillus sp.]|nr:ABC transporter ATP-binding protein [Alicyclobacillus sp.]
MAEPLLRVENVSKSFRVGRRTLKAVRNVTLDLAYGEALGIVGESGSGKSTLARCVMGLLKADTGRILFNGTEIVGLRRRLMRTVWRELQIVFQDASAALNTRMTVGQNVEAPLVAQGVGSRSDRHSRIKELLEMVGLSAGISEAYPFELSGGQQQRVLIARSLALKPRLVVLDEPVSSLDVSVQAQILELLNRLRQEQGLSYLFISHNLQAVAQVCDRVAVMYLGEVVELTSVKALFEAPQHPYTRALVDSILWLPESKMNRKVLRPLPGEVPSLMQVPKGCVFHTRCPMATGQCQVEAPILRSFSDGRAVACHLV